MSGLPAADSARILRAYRIRITLFVAAVCLLVLSLGVWLICRNTIDRLQSVETERDQWQRSAEVLQTLQLAEGDVVADLGSGAGYFSLKLSRAVGARGRVVAIDVRRDSLFFLWLRAWLQKRNNIEVSRATVEGVRFAPSSLHAALIANAYHEFPNPELVLGRVLTALAPGGRLVVLEPGPFSAGNREESHEHHLAAATVEEQLRRSGFAIIDAQNPFIKPPGRPSWWLIVAQKPRRT